MKINKPLFKRLVVGITFTLFCFFFNSSTIQAQSAPDYYQMGIELVNDLTVVISDQENEQIRNLKDSLTEFDLEYRVEELAKEYEIEPKRTSIDLEEDYRIESLLLKEEGKSYGIEIIAIYQTDQLRYLVSQYYGPIESIKESDQAIKMARGVAKDFQITASLEGDSGEEDGLLVEVRSEDQQEEYRLAYFREQAVLSDYLINEFLKRQGIEGINSQLTLELAEKREIPQPVDKKSNDLEADKRPLKDQLKGLIPASLPQSKIVNVDDYEENISKLQDQIELYQSKTQTEITLNNFSRNFITEQLGQASRSQEEDNLLLEEYYFLSTNKLVYLDLTYTEEQLLQANFHYFDENSFIEDRDFQSLLTAYENNGYITVAEIEEVLGLADSSAYYLMTGFSYYSWISFSDSMQQLTASLQQNQVINLQLDESSD